VSIIPALIQDSVYMGVQTVTQGDQKVIQPILKYLLIVAVNTIHFD
jgi:hypothetical protein